MTASPAIAVATSIPPKLSRQDAGRPVDGEYQKLCISSWVECGFRILSINAPDEIPDLATRYPQVTFIETDRNAGWLSGRSNPYIADLLLALTKVPERVVGIINSDIVFEPSSEWRARLPKLTVDTVVTGQRCDTSSLLDGALRRFLWGFDYFFFEPRLADALAGTAMPFAMGLPWWDYWLPMAANLEGYEVVALDRPAVVHLTHATAYVESLWRQLGLTFATYLARRSAEHVGAAPASLGSVVPLARALVERRSSSAEHARLMPSLHNMALQYVRDLRSSTGSLDREEDDPDFSSSMASQPSDRAPIHVFRNLDNRLAAGELLERARQLETKWQIGEAASAYRSALDRTPKDFDALFGLGECLFRQGNVQDALALFRKAETERPEAPEIMSRLGVSLRAAKKHQEAIEYFEKATRFAPQNQMNHYDLALTLEETDRPQEAIGLLEAAVGKWPEFTLASDMLKRLRRAYPVA